MKEESDSGIVTEEIKQVLKDQTDPHCSILEFANVRIYFSYEGEDIFEYTNLEGCLCLIANREHSCLFLCLYNYLHYEKDFEIELYTNIEKGYSVLHDYFHCIDYKAFSVGINFANKTVAQKMKNSIFFNTLILNFDPKEFHLPNSKKAVLDEQKNAQVIKDLQSDSVFSPKGEPFSIVTFGLNKERNEVLFKIEKEEFDKNISSLGIYYANIEGHCSQKIKGKVITDPSEQLPKFSKFDNYADKKFVKFNIDKRKSINARNTIKSQATSSSIGETNEQQQRRPSIKHELFVQNKINSLEHRSTQEEINNIQLNNSLKKQIPKKNSLRVQHYSNDPALQLALKLQNSQIREVDEDE